MGQQWQVGEPKGGGFGSSDHFGTPATPEEWICLPAVGKWRVGRQWPVGEPERCVFGGGWVGNGRLVGQKVASSVL